MTKIYLCHILITSTNIIKIQKFNQIKFIYLYI